MQLDLFDVHQGRAYGLGHHDAVAGGAGGVGGHGALQVGTVLGVHILIGAEAARRQDHGLAADGVVRVLAFSPDRGDLSVFHDELRGPGVQHHLDAH